MQVNRDSKGMSLQSEINVTPLVDVVLVLLIIFMVVIPLAMQGYDVDMPRTSVDAPPTPAVEAQVVLSIGPTSCNLDAPPPGDGLPAACRVTIADTEIPVSELPTRVAQLLGNRPANGRVLFLAADDTLNYEGVLRIVDLAKSKLDDVAIEVITTH
jgi:biopolymer transport protein ExbD